MPLRITSEMAGIAARVRGHLANGTTSEMLAHEVIKLTQHDKVKVRVPGPVSAVFKRPEDEGKTFEAIYGDFTTDAILSVQGQRIFNGEYRATGKLSQEIRATATGQGSLGGRALETLLTACADVDDSACNEWAEQTVVALDSVGENAEKAPRKPKAEKPMTEIVGKQPA